jgi:hypothetical protein
VPGLGFDPLSQWERAGMRGSPLRGDILPPSP